MRVTILSPMPSMRWVPRPLLNRVEHSMGSSAQITLSGNFALISSPAARVPAEPGAGKGDGTFGSQEIIGVFPATAIAAADLNHDGKLDLLVNSKTVLVLLGNGDGTFQMPSSTGGTTSGRIVIADFNRDGNPDFAITAGIPPVLQVFPGKGDGRSEEHTSEL